MKQRMGRKIAGLIGVLILGASSGYAQGQINTVAGSAWSFPATPITATSAPLGTVTAVAVDASGNVYACDIGNRRVVKMTVAGSLTVVAGTGSFGYSGDGGLATSAALSFCFGVAVDSSNNVYIADTLNHVIRKVTGTTITKVAGDGFTDANGNGRFLGEGVAATSASLNFPYGVAVDGANPPNIYIADTVNNRIRKVDAVTKFISTVAGTGDPTVLNQPNAVAVSGVNLYIADTLNHRIRKVATTGGAITTVAGTGTAGGTGDGGFATLALLDNPLGVWVAGTDIYVADTFNGRVRKFTDGGDINAFAGNGNYSFSGDGGSPTAAAFASPSGVAVDAAGATVYIADTDNKRVRKVTPLISGTIRTFAGNGEFKYRSGAVGGDNVAPTSAFLNLPSGVAAQVDASKNITLYIADTNNNRIRKVTLPASGVNPIITTLAGTGQFGFAGDSGDATLAQFNVPSGVALDASGNNLYIADRYNHRIRKVDLSLPTPTINTVAGDGTTAVLNQPTGVALDGLGNVFIADKNNHRVRRLSGCPSACGALTTVAGTGTAGGLGDGALATLAQLNTPTGVTVSGSTIYVADTFNHRVRKFTVGGNITTVAGTGTLGFSADFPVPILATTAQLNQPSGAAVDLAGNVFIADKNNHRIRKVNASDGKITTVAGNGSFDFSGDGGAGTSAAIATPSGVTLDTLGNLLIADTSNDRVRKLFAGVVTAGTAAGPPAGFARIPITLSLFGGATVDSVTFSLKLIPAVGPPPTLGNTLTFSSAIGTTPSISGAAADEITIAWANLSTPLSGALSLGEVVVSLPGTAADVNKTWTIRITGASGSLAGANAALAAGADATLTLSLGTYLVGDSSPLRTNLNPGTGPGQDNDRDDAGEFGDPSPGVLTILDVIDALRISTNTNDPLVLPTPPSCSDRFDAMDADQVGGGNGVLNTLDLIATLRRVNNLDQTRPARTSRALSCP